MPSKPAVMAPVRWLSAREASAYLDFPSVVAFHRWAQRERRKAQPRLRVHWLGRRMRFRQVDLDACLEPEPMRSDRPRLRAIR